MMTNKDWEELEKWEQNRKNKFIEKYGMDISDTNEDYINKIKKVSTKIEKIKKITKWLCVLVIIIILLLMLGVTTQWSQYIWNLE